MSAVTFPVPAGTPVRQCKRCPQWIALMPTKAGKTMPIDMQVPTSLTLTAAGELVTTLRFNGESHFATCPHADEFRRPRT